MKADFGLGVVLARYESEIFKLIVIGLLVLNAVIGWQMLSKLSALQEWNLLGNGGVEHYTELKNLYQTSEYQQYFGDEIRMLKQKISSFGTGQ